MVGVVLGLGLIAWLVIGVMRSSARSRQQRALSARIDYLENWRLEHYDAPWLTTWSAIFRRCACGTSLW
jgi:hypothetical protein